MREPLEMKLPKWPFFLGDALLLGTAWYVFYQSKLPMGAWQIFFVVACVAGGACLGIMPFLLDYHLTLKMAEVDALTRSVAQIRNLETVAAQISSATGHWQIAQEQADKTAGVSKSIADRMAAELQAFTQFMQKANDAEKANLRLEVEKLHRAETEWVQVLVRMLDHVFAIHLGALRSGQPSLIEQLGSFQNACRDAARRVGLTPFTAGDAERFDPHKHQLIEGDPKTVGDALVAETVAAGYTFQGRLLRPALVRLRDGDGADAAHSGPAGPVNPDQSQFELGDRPRA